MAPKKMTVEDARELKGDLELTIKEALEEFTNQTGIVVTKLSVKLADPNEDPGQLALMDLEIYVDVDSMAVL